MKTHVTFILDSSGSMEKIAEDTKGGYNSLLQEQTREEGSATVSIYEFSDDVERKYHGIAIEAASDLTDENYTPSGKTALFDAITRAIKETGEHISSLNDKTKPDHVLVVILTDGKENASETSQDTVRKRIEMRQNEDNWEFLFIGANQDAALTAEKMGMDRNKSLDMSHNPEGTQAAYKSTSERISQARREGSVEGYTEKDREKQRKAEDSGE